MIRILDCGRDLGLMMKCGVHVLLLLLLVSKRLEPILIPIDVLSGRDIVRIVKRGGWTNHLGWMARVNPRFSTVRRMCPAVGCEVFDVMVQLDTGTMGQRCTHESRIWRDRRAG